MMPRMEYGERITRRRAVLSLLAFAAGGCVVPAKTRIPTRSYRGVTRVACIGDSITAGAGLPDPAESSYPAVLARILGPAYEVRNFGVSGATMLRDGDLPYFDTPQFTQALDYAPQIVVIALGTNDSKPQNWRLYGSAFERDTYTMVRRFLSLRSRPVVYLCTPPPVFQDRWGINEATVGGEIAPLLRQLAIREGWPEVDLHHALRDSGEHFPDGVHPDAAGAALIASAVEAAFRGR